MKDAVIVAGGRTAIGKAGKGSLRYTRTDSLGAQVIKGILRDIPRDVIEQIEDVTIGCSTPESVQGQNVARSIVVLADLPVSVGGQTINRFCSSGLQAIATKAYAIMCGQERIAIAGGIESMSMIPSVGFNPMTSLELYRKNPNWLISMGHTAETVAERYGITREEQDMFAVRSHQNAARAREAGLFKDEIIPVQAVGEERGSTFTFDVDEGIRPGTNMESLSRLKPVFKVGGTVTAGTSSQTSDGAAAVLMMDGDVAKQYGLKPIARFVAFAVSGVDPEVMGIGPIKAIPKALNVAGLSIDDIDLIELNEAFASQSLACIKVLELPMEKINVNGGAIAMGHPLGCSGSLLTVKMLNELRRRNGRYGMVTMCIGGGQGAAGIFELL